MILASIFGFIGGIALGSFIPLDIWVVTAFLVFSGAAFAYGYCVEGTGRKILLFSAIIILSISAGAGRIYFSNLYSGSELARFADQKIVAEGVIADDPDVREKNTILTIKLSEITLASTTSEVSEKVRVTASIYPEFAYGDKVRMSMILREPKEIEGDDGRVFDYAGYLRVRGIWYTASFTKVDYVSSGNGNVIKSALFKIKHAFTHALSLAIPEPESSLMAGLLLGTKQSLGKEILGEFQRTGTSHIVVLSGYNIAIVAESIMAVLVFLPKTLSFGVGLVSIVLFTILSGGGASAWRAAIMVLVALFAKKLNRDYKASRAFGFAIVLMLAPNPLLLVFDPSFQLSVLATIGLIFVSPYISPYLTKVTERFGLREIISSTIATQITVLPFLIYNTGILSLVSLPVNVLILGTIPITMLFGFLTGVTGLVSMYLSFIPALPAYALLWYQLTIVHLGASLSWGATKLPAFSPAVLLGVYGIILTSLYFIRKKSTVRS